MLDVVQTKQQGPTNLFQKSGYDLNQSWNHLFFRFHLQLWRCIIALQSMACIDHSNIKQYHHQFASTHKFADTCRSRMFSWYYLGRKITCFPENHLILHSCFVSRRDYHIIIYILLLHVRLYTIAHWLICQTSRASRVPGANLSCSISRSLVFGSKRNPKIELYSNPFFFCQVLEVYLHMYNIYTII